MDSDTEMENLPEEEMDTCGLLIDIMPNYPLLYDLSHRDYKNSNKKEQAWIELADIIKKSVDECQKLWKSVRDRYTREKRLEGKSGSEAPSSKWYYFDKLTFYSKYTKPRKTITATYKPEPKLKVAETQGIRSSGCSSGPSIWSTIDQMMSPVASPETQSMAGEETVGSVLAPGALQEAPGTSKNIMRDTPKATPPTARKRKIISIQEDDLVNTAKRIAESISDTSKVLTDQAGNVPNANRTFIEHLYSLLEEMSPDEAKAKRKTILVAMYDL